MRSYQTGSCLRCHNCPYQKICITKGLSSLELDELNLSLRRKAPSQKGELLYRSGDSMESLYVIRSGSVKTYGISEDGEESASEIHLAGDVIGFEALLDLTHSRYAEALEVSMICELPIDNLERLTAKMPSFRRQIGRLMSAQIQKQKKHTRLLASRNVGARVASFVHDLSERSKERGLSAEHIRMPVPLADIAHHLGMTKETVSRQITGLRNSGVITKQGRDLTIVDMKKLTNLTA